MSRGFHDSPHPPSLKAADKQMSWVVQPAPVWRRQQIKAALIALSQHKQNGDDATLTRSVAAPTFAYFISIHLNVPPPTIPPTTTTTSHLSGDGAYHGTGPGRWLLLPQFYNEKSANLKKKKIHIQLSSSGLGSSSFLSLSTAHLGTSRVCGRGVWMSAIFTEQLIVYSTSQPSLRPPPPASLRPTGLF